MSYNSGDILKGGDLDLTFGTGGKVKTDFFGAADTGRSVAIQSDSKIVVGGAVDNSGMKFGAVRYNANGTLDTTFALDGKFLIEIGGRGSTCKSVGIQSNGNIILGGETALHPTNFSAMGLVRLNTNGVLDTQFGYNDGKSFTPTFGYNNEYGLTLKILPDDKILQGGYGLTAPESYASFLLARHNANGLLDASFGNGGWTSVDFSGTSILSSLAIQTDGKIVASGYGSLNTRECLSLARFNSNGTLDTSFGTNGKVQRDFGDNSYGNSVALDASGRIVVGGSVGQTFLLTRYNSDGTVDNTFGTNGFTTVSSLGSNSVGNSVLILSSGKILLGGKTRQENNNENFALLCFNTNGTLDTTFGTGGRVTTNFFVTDMSTTGVYNTGYALALQKNLPNDLIIFAGAANNGDFGVLRYYSKTYTVPWPVCFPSGTPVNTDQGSIEIQKIKPNVHTINNFKIIAVTKTVTLEDKIVCIKKNALGENVPSQTTFISKNHKILYNDEMIKAKHLVKKIEDVEFKEYNGEALYNVLLETNNTMTVNNLIVETLDPKNMISQLYNGKLNKADAQNIVVSINKLANEYKRFCTKN